MKIVPSVCDVMCASGSRKKRIGRLEKFSSLKKHLPRIRYPGAGQKTPEIFSYMHHPTKNDVTSGLNLASQLVSQSEKMAFRLLKISLYL